MKGAALLVAIVLLTAWVSRVFDGRGALREAEAAAKRGDHVEAIVAARAAADARCPLCESSELGYARLYATAKDAEGRGDDATAAAAWRAVRAAALSGAILDVSPPRRERADVELARLGHRIDMAGAAAGATSAPAAAEDRLRTALATTEVPGGLTLLLLAAGGALFLAAAARFGASRTFRGGELAAAGAGVAVAISGLLFF